MVEQDPNDEPASVLLERIRAERALASKKEKLPRRPKVMISKSKDEDRIGVLQAMQEAGEEISTEQLFLAAGYPPDAESELVEDFFVEIRLDSDLFFFSGPRKSAIIILTYTI